MKFVERSRDKNMTRIRLSILFASLAISLRVCQAWTFPEDRCVISGRILDAESREPLGSANVFLAGTTVGTTSSSNGSFLLRSVLTGSQDLVISLVGYERKVVRLQLAIGDSIFLPVVLSPHLLQGEPVQVMANTPKDWQANLELFRDIIRGKGEYADECQLLNPYVIDFKWHGDTLVGTSDSLLWILNPALGYTMGVVIRSFEWNVARDQGVWLVYVLFRESNSESHDQQEKWSAHRRTVYQGSLRHFLWALVHRRMFEEGFEIRTGRWLDYSRRWPKIDANAIQLVQNPGTALLEWKHQNWIRVDNDALSSVPAFLRPIEDPALIDSSGVIVTPLAFELGGKWEGERVGSLLPADYFPEVHP